MQGWAEAEAFLRSGGGLLARTFNSPETAKTTENRKHCLHIPVISIDAEEETIHKNQ